MHMISPEKVVCRQCKYERKIVSNSLLNGLRNVCNNVYALILQMRPMYFDVVAKEI